MAHETASERTALITGVTGQDNSLHELAAIIEDVVGYQGEFVFDASKPDGMPRKLLDITQLHELRWESRITIREDITSACDWFVEHVAVASGKAAYGTDFKS